MQALDAFVDVTKFFEEYVEAQFEYHNYTLRKATMRSYVAMLRFENEVAAHSAMVKACTGIVQIYVELYDAQQEQQEAPAAAATAADEGKDVDLDLGLKDMEALPQAAAYLQHLLDHSYEKMGTHALAFEVYLRQSKLALALKHLRKASSLAGAAVDSDPDVFVMRVKWAQAMAALPAETPPVVVEIFKEEPASATQLPVLFSAFENTCTPGKGAMSLVRMLLATDAKANSARCLALLADSRVLPPHSKTAVAELLLFKRHLVRAVGADDALVKALCATAYSRYPRCLAFLSAEEKAAADSALEGSATRFDAWML
jgi:hypothetical protein